ncbi:MAG: hypothetical protein ACYDCC_14395 [Actinomycetota bacterium]
MKEGSPRIARLAGRAILAALLVVPLAPSHASANASIVESSKFSSTLNPNRRHLEIDSTARRLLEIGQPSDRAGMRVIARDLDSFKTIGSVDVPNALAGAGGFLSAVDELGHRAFFVYPVQAADPSTIRGVLGEGLYSQVVVEDTRTLFGIAAVDTLRMKLLGAATLALLQPQAPQDRSDSNSIGIKAMSYYSDGTHQLLYLVSEPPVGQGNLVVSTHAVVLHEIDVTKLFDSASNSAVDWSYPVTQCALTMARNTPGVVFRSAVDPVVTIPCRQGGAQGLIAGQPAETPGVVQVHIGSDVTKFSSSFYPVSGNLQYGVVTLDPLSERLFIQIDGSTTEAGIWEFDIRSASFIGLIGLPQSYAGGGTTALNVDVSDGRMYAVGAGEPTTILVASTLSDQIDQGSIYDVALDDVPVTQRSVVDPIAHRIILPTSDGAIALSDQIPLTPQEKAFNPDSATTDIAEGANTQVNFIGATQAYGARIRWVGGLNGVERNANTVTEGQYSDLNPNTGGITPPPPSQGTRDLQLARIAQTTLANGEASAQATGAERDLENTDADLAGFTDYIARWGGPDLSSQRWPYPTVQCADFGNAGDDRAESASGATVSCQRAQRNVTAVAVDQTFAQGTVLRIGSSRARSVVYRDPKRGVVSTAEAEAFGIDLGGVAGAGRVYTRAETWATGRPYSSNHVGAGGTFTRIIEHAWVLQNGVRTEICALSCDPFAVRDAFNAALGTRARIDLPMPEPSRERGSAKGYEALVVRDPLERANEASVNEEADTRRMEVPGMVITVFADGRVPSRVVISLAGVSTESHYGIFLVSQAYPFAPTLLPESSSTSSSSSSARTTAGIASRTTPGVAGFLRRILDGIRFAFASPLRAAEVGSTLLFLAGPLILWSRRRRG